MKTIEQTLKKLNQITLLFRLYVKERDMDAQDIAILVSAEEFADSIQRPVTTMYKGNVVMANGTPITEPNEVTKLLAIATKIGMKIRIPDPDSDTLPDQDFAYHEWTGSSQKAWEQLIAMYMAVDEDFTIQFKDENNMPENKHVHWVHMVPGGGNIPDDGWLCDSCSCDVMDVLWGTLE